VAGSTETMVFSLYGAIYDRGQHGFSLGTLCAFLEPLGVSAEASRLVLSRMARKGYFRTRRKGRSSFYFLTDSGLAVIRRAEGRSLDRGPPQPWDGKFRLVSYEMPETMRDARTELAAALRMAGFGRAAAGLWASAREAPDELRRLLDSSPYRDVVTEYLADLRGDAAAFARRIWNVDAHRDRLARFVDAYRTQRFEFEAAAAAGRQPPPAECFHRYFELLSDFVDTMASIPPIPAELLPEGWPAAEADELFRSYRRLVGQGAEAYVQGVYVPFDEGGPGGPEGVSSC